MTRARLLGAILALSVAGPACGIGPLAEENLPDPSRREARTASYQICLTAAEEYGLERMAEYLDARSARPRAITRAFVREAIRATIQVRKTATMKPEATRSRAKSAGKRLTARTRLVRLSIGEATAKASDGPNAALPL